MNWQMTMLIWMPLFTMMATAQESLDTTRWKKGGQVSINISGVTFSDYWASGRVKSISGNGILNLFAHYKKDKISWDNTLDLRYGFLSQEQKYPIKSDDKIDLVSKFGKAASGKWHYSTLFNFKTQFSEGFKGPDRNMVISDFMAPAYFTTAMGMEYKPSGNLSLFLSPASLKLTIVNANNLRESFGLAADKRTKTEGGLYTKLFYKCELMEQVTFQSKLDLFMSYFYNPTLDVDVNWENLIGMKVNKYISANIFLHMIYDDDIKFIIEELDGNNQVVRSHKGPRTQLKYGLNLGFSYSF